MINIIMATCKKNHRIIRRAYPWTFMLERILIGFYTVLFSYLIYIYLFGGKISSEFAVYTGTADYLTYMVIGIGGYTIAVATLMNVGRSLMTELREGTLEMLFLSPASRRGYLIGVFTEQFFRSFLEFACILFIGWLLGASFSTFKLFDFFLAFLLAVFSFFSLAVFLAALMLYLRDTYITQNTLFIIMSFISGMSFPIEYLPQWIQYLSHLFPLTTSLKLLRDLAFSGETIGTYSELIIELILLSVLYCLLGFNLIRKAEIYVLEHNYT